MSSDQHLDMRYDTSSVDSSTAHDILNNSTQLELMEIFHRFGDEKFSKNIASAIISHRQKSNIINTTGDLKEIIFAENKKSRNTDPN